MGFNKMLARNISFRDGKGEKFVSIENWLGLIITIILNVAGAFSWFYGMTLPFDTWAKISVIVVSVWVFGESFGSLSSFLYWLFQPISAEEFAEVN